MQITHNWKTYKWIGNFYWTIPTYWLDTELRVDWLGRIEIVSYTHPPLERTTISHSYSTYHTPEQLVKLGYMELITKPEEKPTECLSHWECAYMKNWKLLCTLCDKDCRIIFKKPYHDKAMDEVHWVEEEIPEVQPLYIKKVWEWVCNVEMIDIILSRLELLTTSLNLLIKAHNNK